jgi:hypothetical protein
LKGIFNHFQVKNMNSQKNPPTSCLVGDKFCHPN